MKSTQIFLSIFTVFLLVSVVMAQSFTKPSFAPSGSSKTFSIECDDDTQYPISHSGGNTNCVDLPPLPPTCDDGQYLTYGGSEYSCDSLGTASTPPTCTAEQYLTSSNGISYTCATLPPLPPNSCRTNEVLTYNDGRFECEDPEQSAEEPTPTSCTIGGLSGILVTDSYLIENDIDACAIVQSTCPTGYVKYRDYNSGGSTCVKGGRLRADIYWYDDQGDNEACGIKFYLETNPSNAVCFDRRTYDNVNNKYVECHGLTRKVFLGESTDGYSHQLFHHQDTQCTRQTGRTNHFGSRTVPRTQIEMLNIIDKDILGCNNSSRCVIYKQGSHRRLGGSSDNASVDYYLRSL